MSEQEKWMSPSEVFAVRLRETRKTRRLSQGELARMVSERGVPMSKTAVLRFERGERGLSLDEALALANALNAVPAYLLSPPEGAFVAVSNSFAMNGEGVREWLQYGLWDWTPAPDAGHKAGKSANFQARLATLAQSLVDAVGGKDEAGVRTIVEAIVREVVRYHRAHGNDAAADG
jgi:transcriptional regulator with XRE-family HTH domain